jgi:hypothetical protein
MVSDGNACVLSGVGFRVIADGRPWVRHWYGEPLAGKHLLLHCAMGIGDEFIAARLAAIIKRVHGAGKVTFACFSTHHDFWPAPAELPFALIGEIVPFADWCAADFHVAHEGWWESFKAPDQPDVWATMERACGISIAPTDRVPLVPIVPDSVVTRTAETLDAWLKGRPLVLWALAASSRIRSYAPFETFQAMRKLVAKTGCGIVAIAHPQQVEEYGVESGEDVTVYSAGVPGMIALIKLAAGRQPGAVLVSPESAAVHVAACYPALPVVSLWSSFDPAKRIAAYHNNTPIYQRVRCSPCYAHEYYSDGRRSLTGCPLSGCNGYCHGLQAIAPDVIVREVAKLIVRTRDTAKEAEPCKV